MKKNNVFLVLLCLTIGVVLYSCSFVKKEMSVTGTNGVKYTSYRNACSQGDFDAAREFVEKMKNTEGYYGDDIREAETYVLNEEIQYLASLNENQANDRIIFLLNHQKIEGVEEAEGILIQTNVYGTDLKNPTFQKGALKDYSKYINWCGKFNSMCNSILNASISSGNQSLAKKILYSFRKDPELLLKNKHKEEEIDQDYYYDVYAHYTNNSIDAAKKKYEEAVKSGAFSE